MEDELNAAGADGYRFVGTQGGETAFGGSEVVVVMERDPEGRRYRYMLLATSRTGTMERELNGVPPEFEVVGMTVFNSTFGGDESAVILQAEASAFTTGSNAPSGTPSGGRPTSRRPGGRASTSLRRTAPANSSRRMPSGASRRKAEGCSADRSSSRSSRGSTPRPEPPTTIRPSTSRRPIRAPSTI